MRLQGHASFIVDSKHAIPPPIRPSCRGHLSRPGTTEDIASHSFQGNVAVMFLLLMTTPCFEAPLVFRFHARIKKGTQGCQSVTFIYDHFLVQTPREVLRTATSHRRGAEAMCNGTQWAGGGTPWQFIHGEFLTLKTPHLPHVSWPRRR